MNRSSPVIALVVAAVIASLFVMVLDVPIIDQSDPDEMCAAVQGDGWTHFEAEDTGGFYCQAPNGSVHRTVLHMTGPQYSWEHLALVGGIFGLTLVVGLVATLPKRWAARTK